jgi:hypothetical protein
MSSTRPCGGTRIRRKVPLLGKLGVVERLLRALEIGAAVLPIGVEEQDVKSAVEIVVVVRGVAPRSPARIELFNAAQQIADEPAQPYPPGRALAALTEQDGKDVGDRARFDDNAGIHIRFAEFQCGIEEDAPLGRPRGEADSRGCPGAVPKGESRSPRSGHPEVSGADSEYQPKQAIHPPPPAADNPRGTINQILPMSDECKILICQPRTLGITARELCIGHARPSPRHRL